MTPTNPPAPDPILPPVPDVARLEARLAALESRDDPSPALRQEIAELRARLDAAELDDDDDDDDTAPAPRRRRRAAPPPAPADPWKDA
jgi:hypothetical protein